MADPFDHLDYCVDRVGKLYFCVVDSAGTSVYQYNVTNKASHKLFTAPQREYDGALTCDAAHLYFAFAPDQTGTAGIVIYDLKRLAARAVRDDRFVGATEMSISPDEKQLVYARWGENRGPLGLSNSRNCLTEYTVEGNTFADVAQGVKADSMFNPVYIDNTRVAFTADVETPGAGDRYEYYEASGRETLQRQSLPFHVTLRLLGSASGGAEFLAIGIRASDRLSHVVLVHRSAIGRTSNWQLTPIVVGEAKYCASDDSLYVRSSDDRNLVVTKIRLDHTRRQDTYRLYSM